MWHHSRDSLLYGSKVFFNTDPFIFIERLFSPARMDSDRGKAILIYFTYLSRFKCIFEVACCYEQILASILMSSLNNLLSVICMMMFMVVGGAKLIVREIGSNIVEFVRVCLHKVSFDHN